jgi:PadR family transcriptional regulator PadR
MFRPDRELLTAWLLLVLARGSGYGYGIAEQMREQELDFELTVVYRTLRALERDEAVTSRWIGSPTGPRRRLYSETPTGRRALDGLVDVVMTSRRRYQDLVEASASRDPRNGEQEPSAPVPPPPRHHARSGSDHELLEGWLLLLLDADVTYGYDLHRHLDEHDVKADAAKVYRLLRRMDRAGWLRSRWSGAVLGPQRRVYRLTAAGRDHLHEIVGAITHARDMHDAFIRAHHDLDHDHLPPTVSGAGAPGSWRVR